MFTKPKNILPEEEHGFTLIELIVVIIIVGILAAIGMTQYSSIVEKSRLAEAKVRLGTMRTLAYQYYLENGSLTSMQTADVGVDGVCHSTDFYAYQAFPQGPADVRLQAYRCGAGGKTPNYSGTPYSCGFEFNPATGATCWFCNNGTTGIFGAPMWCSVS